MVTFVTMAVFIAVPGLLLGFACGFYYLPLMLTRARHLFTDPMMNDTMGAWKFRFWAGVAAGCAGSALFQAWAWWKKAAGRRRETESRG